MNEPDTVKLRRSIVAKFPKQMTPEQHLYAFTLADLISILWWENPGEAEALEDNLIKLLKAMEAK
jgi:hypothetical protein